MKIVIYLLLFQYLFLWVALRFFPDSYSEMGSFSILFIYISFFSLYPKFKRYIQSFFVFYCFFIFVFVFFLFLHSLYHSYPFNSAVVYFRNFFHALLLFPICSLAVADRKFIYIFYFILYFLLFQSVLYVSSFWIPQLKSLFIIEFIYRNGEFERVISEQVAIGNPAIGTFVRPANFGNFLALFLPFFVFLYSYSYIKIKKVYFILVFVLLLVALVGTGIRASFFSFLILLFMFLSQIYSRKILIYYSICIIGVFIIYTAIETVDFDSSMRSSFENPLIRILYGFNLFVSDESLVEGSTLVRSSSIFAYFSNFLVGSGIYMTNGYYVGIASISDLTLAFIFIEFGIIVFLAALFPFLILPKFSYCRPYSMKMFFFLFSIMLLQSITDQGLFSNYTSVPFILFSSFLLSTKSYD